MFVYFYYLILYFFTIIFGMQIISFADPIISKLIMSSILAVIFSTLLHFIYMWRGASNTFLKRFYQVHFLATYISGAFTIVNIGGKTLEEWGFKGTIVDGDVKITYLMMFFTAISNNAFYKTFEKEIVDKLESTVSKMKLKIKKNKVKLP